MGVTAKHLCAVSSRGHWRCGRRREAAAAVRLRMSVGPGGARLGRSGIANVHYPVRVEGKSMATSVKRTTKLLWKEGRRGFRFLTPLIATLLLACACGGWKRA